jgi:2-C-methyl-D-erythritol 4-phosphate cytidylyltransferase/2-C-methyl-D-erythritol 2,4-cyclodiphosphate synthase
LSFALLMPAAGGGVRLGSDGPKALVEIAGAPMFVHAAQPFVRHAQCIEAVVAAPSGWESRFREIADHAWGKERVRVVTGGTTRQESVARSLAALVLDAEFVLVHDAARPLIGATLIARVLAALSEAVAAVPVLPVTDTLKRIAGSGVAETVDRGVLVVAQTPQGMLRTAAEEAQRRAHATGFEGTDDVSLIEHFALGSVKAVAGDPGNFKITTGEDLALARKLMELEGNRAGDAGKDQ